MVKLKTSHLSKRKIQREQKKSSGERKVEN